MGEYIFEINDALYNEKTGQAVMKPEYKGKLVRCKDCKHADEYYHCIFSTIWNDMNHYCGKGERKDG